MLSDGNQAGSFIPILYRTMQAAGFSNTSLTCCDATGWNVQRTMTSALVSGGIEQYLGTITSHAYTSDPNTPISTKLKVWQTEACDLNSAWCTTWYGNGGQCEGLTWANKLHVGIVNANLSAYIYWQGVEVNQFQAASYLVASDGNNVTPSGRLWAFAMWSRFIRPGARRLTTSGSVSSTGFGAFRNTDGTVVTVFTNTGGSAQSVKISFNNFTATVAEGWVTDNTRSVASYAVTLSAGAVTVSIPARAVVTVKLTADPPTSTTTTTTSTTTTTTTTTATTTTEQPTTTPPTGCQATKYSQCGGIGWTGCTTCASGSTCTRVNDYFSQCL